MKVIEEMKEVIYENENKLSEYDLNIEEQKNNYNDIIANQKKELNKARENELDLSKKYEQLKKKYDQENELLKSSGEHEKQLNDQRMQDLEAQLKETQDTFVMGKQAWAKEQAVLEQKLEYAQYQLEDEKKKFEENKQNHESMLKSLQSSNREQVIGREEAQIKINEMEQKFMNEGKQQEAQYTEYRKRLTNDLEKLKTKNNELELSQKILQGELEKETSTLKEQLLEAEQARDHAIKQLKNIDSSKGALVAQAETRFQQREKELEYKLEEKDKEIDELIYENKTKSETTLNEIKKFYEEEKERLEKRSVDEKQRFEKKLNQAIEDYEENIQEQNNNHEDAYLALEDEKNQTEMSLQNQLIQLQKENQVILQQLESKEKQLNDLKENYNNLQNNANKQNDHQAEKFSKERRDLNDKVENLTAEISKRERTILSIEN